jgi:hypothetical protein
METAINSTPLTTPPLQDAYLHPLQLTPQPLPRLFHRINMVLQARTLPLQEPPWQLRLAPQHGPEPIRVEPLGHARVQLSSRSAVHWHSGGRIPG